MQYKSNEILDFVGFQSWGVFTFNTSLFHENSGVFHCNIITCCILFVVSLLMRVIMSSIFREPRIVIYSTRLINVYLIVVAF